MLKHWRTSYALYCSSRKSKLGITENLWAKKKGNFVIGHVTILEKVKLYQFIHTHHFNLRLFMDFFWFVEGLICEI